VSSIFLKDSHILCDCTRF